MLLKLTRIKRDCSARLVSYVDSISLVGKVLVFNANAVVVRNMAKQRPAHLVFRFGAGIVSPSQNRIILGIQSTWDRGPPTITEFISCKSDKHNLH